MADELPETETIVTGHDPTPPHKNDIRPATREPVLSPPRRRPHPDESTDTMPRLPSQKVVDAVFAMRSIGLGGTITLVIVAGIFWTAPWVGINVVIPFVKIGESIVKVAETSVVVSADILEEKKHMRAMLDSKNTIEQQQLNDLRDIKDSLRILVGKTP